MATDKNIYGSDIVDGGQAGDVISDTLSTLNKLNRADTNSVNDDRAKSDLGYPAKKGT